MIKIRVRELAAADINKAMRQYYYWGQDEEFWNDLQQKYEYLKRYPAHSAVKYGNVRIDRLENFPYNVHYIWEENLIRIVGVFHQREDSRKWFNRK